ncbi:tetraspanin-9-like [Cimex lectularius]|uniref:Tetraspanin n=1 Tax=Cimex lectularius TaxID=79782 RepID=A0A8I6RXS6_CIMLE|nr:tetraspanin-9-like [Cimex lectularius]
MLEEIGSSLRRFSSVTVKYTLCLFNLILLLSGVTLLCLGIIIKEAYKEYEPIVDDSYFSASTLLITAGSLLFVFAFFGCWGAYMENYHLLITYSIMIGLVFLIEIAAVITGYSLSEKPEDILFKTLNTSFHTQTNVSKLFWGKMETMMDCCGINSVDDYTPMNVTVPGTCCHRAYNETCPGNATYSPGCFDKVKNMIERNALTIGTGALSAILLQIIGMFCALCLAKSIMNSYETL